MRLRAALLLAAVLGVAGCGITRAQPPGAADTRSSVATTSSPASPSAAGPSASTSPDGSSPAAGQVLGVASNPAGWSVVVTAWSGARLEVTVTVPGPLTVEGGCVSTLTASAETEAGVVVSTATPGPALRCMAIAMVSIPAGSSRTFTTIIPEPPQPGSYIVQAALRTAGTRAAAMPKVTISL